MSKAGKREKRKRKKARKYRGPATMADALRCQRKGCDHDPRLHYGIGKRLCQDISCGCKGYKHKKVRR